MRAESYRDKAAAGGAAKEAKPAEPKWEKNKDDPNVETDTRTLITKTWVPAQEAVPEKSGLISGWMGKNAPAKPAVPGHYELAMPDGSPLSMSDFHKIYDKAMDKVSLPEPQTLTEPSRAPAPAAAATAPSMGGSSPPAGAIAKLQANPSMAAAFDAKYGPGASARYLRR
jgi:hypothetical protein